MVAFDTHRYSTNVLVGNWYEDRLVDQIDRMAVVPGVFGKSDCAKTLSEFKNQYVAPDALDCSMEYNAWKQSGFRNRLRGEATALKMFDGHQFETNFTTMSDVMFAIQPKKVVELEATQKEPHPKEKKPLVEPLSSYGNATEYGLLKAIQCDLQREKNYNWCTSTYREAYPPKTPFPMERRPKKTH